MPADNGWLVEPIEVIGHVIGGVVIASDPLRTASADLDRLRSLVRRLVATVVELCEQDVVLAQRNEELNILFRLSSLLVTARDLDTTLRVALRVATESIGADAGAIHLLDEDRRTFRLRAHSGISDRFASRFRPAPPREGAAPLAPPAPGPGAPPPIERDSEECLVAARADGFEGVVRSELSFHSERLGAIHLFTRRRTLLDPSERVLLQTISEQISAAVASANLLEAERRSRKVQRQLRLAAAVQRRMLPASMPHLPPLDIGARYIPSFDLGGDFYDLMPLGGHLGFFVGDVAGKGVPAALLMAAVRASLRAHASEQYHLDAVLARVNDQLVRDTLPEEFVTVFYGVINPATLRLTYCSAGHDPTLLLRLPSDGRRPAESDLHTLDSGGMVLGVLAEQRYERGMWDLQPGDTVVAYTDGVPDARNFAGEKFGRARLRRAIVDFIGADPGASAQALADHIIWEVRRFVGLNPATDDETVLVVRVGGR
ncbi:MAG TPA: hypothetical protein DEB06_00220 [Phycisphaerales bacterium]|nr:hypothetical protein [Phycisphaerales bacterium]